jgi:hypothetical protein
MVNEGAVLSVSGSEEADMQNPWKVASLGLFALAAIVGTSTLTTAFLLRPPVSQPEQAPSSPDPAAEPRAAIVRVAPAAKSKPVTPGAARATSAVARAAATTPPSELGPAPLSSAVITPTAEASAAVPSPGVVAATPPSAAAAQDCDTAGDRAARIAKPGALGALLGAGLGAAGGAVAKGGKAAGQGALIGALAGAAVGAGYGAHKTKTECGTVFGEGSPTSAPTVSRPTSSAGPTIAGDAPAPFKAAPARAERIQIYEAR